MKRLILIVGAFTLWTALGTSCYLAYEILPLKRKCKVTYEYTDKNGNKGISEHCFMYEDRYICRDIKHITQVKETKKKEVCKWKQ